jgi:hypothetical protein
MLPLAAINFYNSIHCRINCDTIAALNGAKVFTVDNEALMVHGDLDFARMRSVPINDLRRDLARAFVVGSTPAAPVRMKNFDDDVGGQKRSGARRTGRRTARYDHCA